MQTLFAVGLSCVSGRFPFENFLKSFRLPGDPSLTLGYFLLISNEGQITCQNSVRDFCDFKIT